MIRRMLRFSALAATLLAPLALLSQTSQTPQTTTPAQLAAVDQTAASAQLTASLDEAAAPGLKDNLNIHMINPLFSEAVQATPALTCRQRCELEYNACRKAMGTDCEALENSCLKKC